MMVAILLLAVFHPGRSLVGPESEFPKMSRKEKKAAKKERKAAKKAMKQTKFEAQSTDGLQQPECEEEYHRRDDPSPARLEEAGGELQIMGTR